jgi:hypothetical protein
MGIQGVYNPSFLENYVAFGDDVAGIVANYKFTPVVGLTAWWIRPYADNYAYNGTTNPDRNFDEVDAFGLALPLTFDGVKLTPWGMYASRPRRRTEYRRQGSPPHHLRPAAFPGHGPWLTLHAEPRYCRSPLIRNWGWV